MEYSATYVLALQMLAMFVGSVELAESGPVGYLDCDTGVVLQILPNRTVKGSRKAEDQYAVVQLVRSGSTRNVFIYGMKSKKYLCMTKKAKAVGKKKKSKRCLFKIHELQEHYKSFSSKINNEIIYFGLTRSGKARVGSRRSPRTKFVWRPINYKEIQSLKKSENWLQLYYRNVIKR